MSYSLNVWNHYHFRPPNGAMVVHSRPSGKWLRKEEIFEDFWGDPTGSYLKITLKNGSPVQAKGWPWVQAALRGLLGKEKVEKANFLQDGSLLIKTKSQTQTEKLLQATSLLKEECQVVRDAKLNVSKGTIFASDLQELNEEENVQWLDEFGVVGAKKKIKKYQKGKCKSGRNSHHIANFQRAHMSPETHSGLCDISC